MSETSRRSSLRSVCCLFGTRHRHTGFSALPDSFRGRVRRACRTHIATPPSNRANANPAAASMAAQLQCYQLGAARPSSTPQHAASHRQAPPAALPKRAQPLTAWGCRSSASPRWRQPSSPSLAELRTVARAEGDENPLLLRWKERALGEPGFGQGESGAPLACCLDADMRAVGREGGDGEARGRLRGPGRTGGCWYPILGAQAQRL